MEAELCSRITDLDSGFQGIKFRLCQIPFSWSFAYIHQFIMSSVGLVYKLPSSLRLDHSGKSIKGHAHRKPAVTSIPIQVGKVFRILWAYWASFANQAQKILGSFCFVGIQHPRNGHQVLVDRDWSSFLKKGRWVESLAQPGCRQRWVIVWVLEDIAQCLFS